MRLCRREDTRRWKIPTSLPHVYRALADDFTCRDFTDLAILRDFQESLAKSFRDQEDERDQYFGRATRDLIDTAVDSLRIVITRVRSRIQTSNTCAFQMLLVAT